MHRWETRMLLKHYLEQGVSKAELSRRFGVSRRTIHEWIQTGQLERDLTAGGSRYSPRPPVAHKLDRYTAIIDARLEEFPGLLAKRLFEEVRAAGYSGGYTRVREYVRAARPRPAVEPVVLSEQRLGGGELVLNAAFLRFAAHWGFQARACRPYRAQTKGKVERPIRYLRDSFFYGRRFASDEDLNEQASRWVEQTANVRRHSTTGERPLERFERDEREALRPLAQRPYPRLGVAVRSKPSLRRVPQAVQVERRSLRVYAEVVG